MQLTIDVYIIICYNVYIRKREKRRERKTRKRTNGDKKDRQAATTKNLDKRIKAGSPHVLTK